MPFLDFFSCVDNEGACGTAAKLAERVVVSDVRSDPIFVGTDAAPVMERARVRAVQSTPLVGASGEILGVLSTHYAEPRELRAQEFEVLDRIAHRTAFWLDGGTA
jgi:GAF domain-containing protein